MQAQPCRGDAGGGKSFSVVLTNLPSSEDMGLGIENVSVAHFGTENVSVALVKANSDVENDGASLLQSTGQMKVPAKSQGPGYGEDVELGKSKSEMGRGDNTARQIKTGVAFL